MQTPLEQIKKRDGRIVPYDPARIAAAIAKAMQAVQGGDAALREQLAERVAAAVESQAESGLASVEQIQDAIEAVLSEAGLPRAAKAFILYRARRSRIREAKSELMLAVDEVLSGGDPQTSGGSAASKLFAVGAAASREFYLKRLLPEEDAVAHMHGDLHVSGLESYAKAPHSLLVPVGALLAAAAPAPDAHAVLFQLLVALQSLSRELSGPLALDPFDGALAPWLAACDEETLVPALRAFLLALAMPTWRDDAAMPVTLAFGDDASPAARRVAFALLAAADGLKPAPELVMRLRPGLNLDAPDANHDLFQAALSLAARGGLRFAFGDEAVLGGGMRLAGDRFAGAPQGRGVVAVAVINLPRVAFLARRDHQAFEAQLAQVLDLAGRHLAQRMHVLSQLRSRDLPRLMGGGLYAGAAELASSDPLGFALRHGQLNVAFVGLAEALMLMEGAHHGESPAAHQRGLATVKLMRDQVEALAERHDLNIALSGEPASEAAQRFIDLDRRDFGVRPGVTDGSAYSASYRLPEDFRAAPERRVAREADYHRLCPGGNAPLQAPGGLDVVAVEALIRRMHAEGAGLVAFGPAPALVRA